jgi:glyoxalase family protein
MIHHITAICSDAKKNVEFYARILGLHMVKATVNFDDPKSYHLYYGDRKGNPGTLITFFEWKHMEKGKPGSGLWGRLFFSVPANSIGYWKERLKKNDVGFQEDYAEEKAALQFEDYEGMQIGIIEEEAKANYSIAEIPKEHAIIRIIGLEMVLGGIGDDIGIPRHVGYDMDEGLVKRIGIGDSVYAYSKNNSFIKINLANSRGTMGKGSIHHAAFRAKDEEEQLKIRGKVLNHNPTDIVERVYFRSVYFRSPQGIIFEIATDRPGMGVDEKVLGSSLKLPPWLEGHRNEILEGLTPIEFNENGEME